MHIGLQKDFDELTFEAEDAVLETADRKPNGAFTEFQEAHFANKRMTRRHLVLGLPLATSINKVCLGEA